ELDRRRLAAPGPRVYFEIWPQPLQAAGPDSLQGHLLARCGARNVLPDAGGPVPLASAEAVVEADPEIIVHTGIISNADILGRAGWSAPSACRARRIVLVNEDAVSRAGPRILDGWKELLDRLREATERP